MIFSLLFFAAITADPQVPVTLTDIAVPADLKVRYFQTRAILEHSVGDMRVFCKEQGRDLVVIKNVNGDEEDLACHAPSKENPK